MKLPKPPNALSLILEQMAMQFSGNDNLVNNFNYIVSNTTNSQKLFDLPTSQICEVSGLMSRAVTNWRVWSPIFRTD